jgi:superfamily II DNA helicase RecQ
MLTKPAEIKELDDEGQYLVDKHDPFSSMPKNFQPGCFEKGSIIIYVWRRMDAEAMAEQLRGSGVEGGVVFYHGGMDHGQRARAQGQVRQEPPFVFVSSDELLCFR